jgi:multicomponent Na+:H+ antiporter subunit G
VGVFEAFGSLLLVAGCLLSVTGSLGVLRMPDFYSRLHPAGKTDTLGQLLMLSGLMLFAVQQIVALVFAEGGADSTDNATLLGWANLLLKVFLVSALLFVTAPTSTHAIAKAARLDRHTAIVVEGDPRPVASDKSPAVASDAVPVQAVVGENDITRRLDEPWSPEQEDPR